MHAAVQERVCPVELCWAADQTVRPAAANTFSLAASTVYGRHPSFAESSRHSTTCTMNPVAPTAHLASDVRAGRLDPAQYAKNFCDAHPPLNVVQANIEAERCYYCHDAPCATACPTGIDIPSFIHRIAQDNYRGAARAILEANPLGGMCARVCPTEVLCEQACVRNTNEDKPVEIGSLQRYATDAFFEKPGAPLFQRAATT
eukprot:gene53405-71391_t